jgi:Uma2 family endonuclease
VKHESNERSYTQIMTIMAEKPNMVEAFEDGRIKFSLEMFEQLSDTGFFGEAHVELLNGEILVKTMQKPAHAYAIQTLTEKFFAAYQTQACIRVQLPLVLLSPPPDFVEPDLALLKLPAEQYKDRSPTSNDAIVVIEVSDTTLERDRGAKLEAYARNQIPEYWILNVAETKLEVYREPKGNEYRSRTIFTAGEAVRLLGFEGLVAWW